MPSRCSPGHSRHRIFQSSRAHWAKTGGGHAFEILQRHLGEHHRGERPHARRPGRAVEEGHLADQAASLKAADPALHAEPGRRREDFQGALEQNVERPAAAAGLKDGLPGAERRARVNSRSVAQSASDASGSSTAALGEASGPVPG